MTGAFSFLKPLHRVPGVAACLVGRVPEVEVAVDRELALERLAQAHRSAAREGCGVDDWWTAEQVHGAEVAVVGGGTPSRVPGVDGLLTAEPGVALGILVADCGPIWLADPATGAIGLLHSGRKGTEEGILTAAVARMTEHFGSRAEDLVVVLGPCIRPPNYEVDFAGEIARQADRSGVADFHDCGIDTAAAPEAWYSYRREKGKTGRMLALIVRREASA